ncbi:hypothetical protein MPOCJGCO_4943 [Methylobacterium trifolii]|uniref:Helix-turn-helix domain-containing protein n=1 Tax=Methylobacterium trifolii TaxID=1003092 RepID=A0ABQ4U6K4_9HYPH|nr:hypothetical protein MPOCJGCO_4943 [Methylobacterium trifolii]
MSKALGLRADFDAEALRRLARANQNAGQSRRLLVLASIYEGGSRTQAARSGAVGLQTVLDWGLAFNVAGPDGLIERKRAGQRSKLDAAAGADGGHRPAFVVKFISLSARKRTSCQSLLLTETGRRRSMNTEYRAARKQTFDADKPIS